MKPRITVYLSDAQLEYLRRESAKRRRSLSSYVTDCLLDYHVETAPSTRPVDKMSQPFSALLRDTEDRIAKEIGSHTSRANALLSKQLTVLTAMLDRFVLSALVHTPEVPDANKSNAIKSGERRYASWREAVERSLDAISEPNSQASEDGAREEDAA